MAVSSKSIVHYTSSLDALKSIINDGGLRIKYCSEDIHLYDDHKLPGAFPMVCFCDLPLTLAKDHIVKYGSYGIGFSKVWAYNNKLNPVLYLEKNSTITQYITEQTDEIIGEKRRMLAKANAELAEVYEKDRRSYVRLLAFCKNHSGPLIRKGILIDDNYIYYDEREWRYVPNREDIGNHETALSYKTYDQNKDNYNLLISDFLLKFDYADISYIIVKDEEDVSAISQSLNLKYGDTLTPPNMRRLLTKIISVQQIHDDF